MAATHNPQDAGSTPGRPIAYDGRRAVAQKVEDFLDLGYEIVENRVQLSAEAEGQRNYGSTLMPVVEDPPLVPERLD